LDLPAGVSPFRSRCRFFRGFKAAVPVLRFFRSGYNPGRAASAGTHSTNLSDFPTGLAAMTAFPFPSEDNAFLAPHIAILRDSHRHWTGRPLLDPRMTHEEAARYLFFAPFAVASHSADKDPLFNYGNQTALNLFAMDWEEFTATPSRLSAERALQAERAELLARVAERGYIDDYQGIRIGRHGRRFQIEQATVWNLRDARGVACGQAVCIKQWKLL
jgi:hypothetical protein